MIGVLEAVKEERNQAAAQEQSAADEENAHEPGVCPCFVGDVGHDLLLAARAGRHAGRTTQTLVVTHKLLSTFTIVSASTCVYLCGLSGSGGLL